MKTLEDIIKKIVSICIFEVIILSFAIISGIKNGFKLWNWLMIIIGISIYLIFTIVVCINENKGIKKVKREDLRVDNVYKEQAQLILKSIDKYLKENQKIYTDLKLYWPFYKGLLRRISNGQKFNGKDYGVIEQLQIWQKENYEDAFLKKIYDILKNNILL